MKINEQKTKPRTSIGSKQARRYTGKNEKVTPKLNETETGGEPLSAKLHIIV
jgi:hypothetical protein